MTEPRFETVTPPDGSARAHAASLGGASDAVGAATGPLGLGRLGAAAAWVAGCQGQSPPRPLRDPRIVVFVADHGVAVRGVSARAAGSTASLVAALDKGEGALAAFAEAAGAALRVVDVGCAEGSSPGRIRAGSGAIDVEDALTEDEVRAAITAGIAAADAAVDAGADLLVAANLGVGATTTATALVSALTGAEPVAVAGRGSGLDDPGWMRKATAVRDALRRAKPFAGDPIALLRTAGGADLAALAGFLSQAAVRRTPVLLGGLTVCAAGMLAEELAPGARDWWLAPCTTTEPAHERALDHLDLEPLLDLKLDGDAEAAGVTALPLLAAGVRALAAS